MISNKSDLFLIWFKGCSKKPKNQRPSWIKFNWNNFEPILVINYNKYIRFTQGQLNGKNYNWKATCLTLHQFHNHLHRNRFTVPV